LNQTSRIGRVTFIGSFASLLLLIFVKGSVQEPSFAQLTVIFILCVKMVLVAALVALIYVHNVYFGKRIIRLAEERKLRELQALRKQSRIVSATNLILMAAILVLATFLQVPP